MQSFLKDHHKLGLAMTDEQINELSSASLRDLALMIGAAVGALQSAENNRPRPIVYPAGESTAGNPLHLLEDIAIALVARETSDAKATLRAIRDVAREAMGHGDTELAEELGGSSGNRDS